MALDESHMGYIYIRVACGNMSPIIIDSMWWECWQGIRLISSVRIVVVLLPFDLLLSDTFYLF